jgi:hypothetical protein
MEPLFEEAAKMFGHLEGARDLLDSCQAPQ